MEGSPVRFELALKNEGLLPCAFVTIRYNFAGSPVGN